MEKILINASNVEKYYLPGQSIVQGICFSFTNSDFIAITGENGSGKTTLLKLIAGIMRPSKGFIHYKINDSEIEISNWKYHIGYVAPYLNYYEEFSAIEHFKILSNLTLIHFDLEKIKQMIAHFDLDYKNNDPIRTYSSGMKQRIKYIWAFFKQAKVLLFDEPFTNLDTKGIDKVCEYLEIHRKLGGIAFLATNDDREKQLCSKYIELEKQFVQQ